MILILSEEHEKSTDQTIEWLNYWGINFVRINQGLDVLDKLEIRNNQICLILNNGNQMVNLNAITSIWFRRGYLYFKKNFNSQKINHPKAAYQINKHLKDEINTLRNFIYQKLKSKPSLNHPNVYNMNKLIALDKAIEAGFKVPNTIVSNKKGDVIEFQDKEGSLITKNIQDVLSIDMERYRSGHSTCLVEQKELKKADPMFFYSLFQKCIDKKYELRVYYLNGKCYTTAIFSQRDTQTTVDYRNYNEAKMNRVVPYYLPEKIAKKINIFMKSVSLESGSLDIIIDKNGEYIFLEVNPVGQYDYVGANCNYHLGKRVANFLVNPQKRA